MLGPMVLALIFQSPTAPAPVEIRGVSVIDVRNGQLLPERTILVRSGRIESIANQPTNTPGAQVVDGRGLFALPGLVDLHAHLQEDDLDLMLANGITTVREMNGSETALGWRDAIRQGVRRGPTLFVTSPLLSGDSLQFRHALIRSAADARFQAEQFASRGYDFLKVYDGLESDAYMEIAAVGEAHGVRLVGHIPNAVGLRYVIGHGQASIEHAEQILHSTVGHELDTTRIPSIVAMFAGSTTAVTATLAAAEILSDRGSSWFPSLYAREEMRYTPPGVRGWWQSMRRTGGSVGPEGGDSPYLAFQRKLTLALWTAGVPILVGTDTPNPLLVPGFSLLHEMQALERAGIPRAAVLKAATLGAAEHLGVAESVGVIAVGQRGDLVLLGANPLEDLKAVREVRGVVVRGEWLPQAALQQQLDRVAAARAAP